MEKVRYYAIKGPDGELRLGSLNTSEMGAYRAWIGWLAPSCSNWMEVAESYKQDGYRCVEVAEVKEVEGE